MRISRSMLLLFILLLAVIGFAQAAPGVTFTKPDTAVCQRSCWNPQVSAVVAGLDPGQKIDLQLTYYIVNPVFLRTDTVYSGYDNVGNGVYPITPEPLWCQMSLAGHSFGLGSSEYTGQRENCRDPFRGKPA